MPQLGRSTRPEYSRVPSVGALATMVEPEQQMVREVSEQRAWFIYNVGPWSYTESMGSMGNFVIPALDAALVLGEKENEFAVAGPLMVPGLPNETYPREGESSRRYFKHWEKEPGKDFALEICGVGKSRKKSADLRKRGVFISQIVDRYMEAGQMRYRSITKPEKGTPEEAFKLWAAWRSEVKTAHQAFRQWCEFLCGFANTEHSKKRGDNINDHHFAAAHILHKTTAQCPWLDGSAEATQKESCPLCGEPVKTGVAFCPTCKQQIVSDEELEVLKAKIRAKKVA